jgi:L-malate glycosyltransferase
VKVLILAAASSIHTVRWANALAQSGIDVVVATQHEPLKEISAAVRIRRLPFAGETGYFLNIIALRHIIKEEKPDLLNAHYASGYGTTARFSGFQPYLLSVWGSDVYDFPEKSPLHRWWLRRNLMAADRLASTSHAMAKQACRVAPELKEIAITPFGVNTKLFASGETDVTASRATEIVIGTVKTLASHYGIDTLIDSVAILIEALRPDHPDLAQSIRLRIVGNGPQAAELRVRASDRGISDRVEFVPRVAHGEVPRQLRQLDVYVALSRRESFGVAVIEAGACGLPVVVSDVGGLPEVVVQGETGLVVESDNPRAAAQALRKLVLEPNLRQLMGSRGRLHVTSNYEWQNNVKSMIALYEQIVAEKEHK